jgi:hypothetical protein
MQQARHARRREPLRDEVECPLWDCTLDDLDVEPTEEQEAVCQEVGSKAEDCNAGLDDDVVEGSA